MMTPPSDDVPSPLMRLLLRLQRFAWDFGGLFTLSLALLTLLALWPSASGMALLAWGDFLYRWLGWGAWSLPPALLWCGIWMLKQPLAPRAFPWRRMLGWESALFGLLAFLALWSGAALPRAEAGLDGGLIGWGLAQVFLVLFPRPLSLGVSLALLGMGLLTGWGLGASLTNWARARLERAAAPQAEADSPVSVAPVQGQAAPPKTQSVLPRRRRKSAALPPEFRKNFRVEKPDEKPAEPVARDAHLPPLSLLDAQRAFRPDERHINQTAGLIEKTLAEFGVPARVVGFQVGPTITQFALEPGFVRKGGEDEPEPERQKVRVAQIVGLRRDLALALSAERLRIQAPVPGRPYVGIEVPNARMQVVRLRPLLESEAFHKLNAPLGVALGRDVSGRPLVADLGKMPHLLIAGTTGSGKSVCISAITACLAMNNSPRDLRMVMIDPKMVELLRFNGLPHIFGKVETDLERILGVLRWVTAEMDRRYKVLEASRSRHIDSHNRKMARRKQGEHLPRIVVVVDELADLMMAAPDQTEHALVRLAQLARAVGIHLVVATQRPSTDVVTGLIKANFPARLSFAVASGIDSRVILDAPGAEALLGRGDMLFLPPDAPAPLRAQGVMVTDREIQRLIAHWQQQAGADGQPPPWEEMLEAEAYLADRDDLVEKAVEIVRQTRRASASMLQRRLRIGYPRAARLMEELESLGVVGPSPGGGRPREVLLDEEPPA